MPIHSVAIARSPPADESSRNSHNISTNNSSSSTGNSSHGRKRGDRHVADGAAAPKRIRVSRACDQCRAGREKCDGIQPVCHSCQVQQRACTYNEQPKKRGIQPHYIRTLELTLAWLLRASPDSEARLAQRLPDLNSEAHQLISCKDVARSDALHQSWRSALVSRQIDQLLSGAVIERPDGKAVSSEGEAAASSSASSSTHTGSNIDALLDELQRPHTATTASTAIGRVSSLPIAEQSCAPDASPELLVLPVDSWPLLEHYFAFTQSWFPIIEKHDILKLMYSYPASGLPKSAAAAGGDHAELWSLLSLSATQQNSAFGIAAATSLAEVAKALIPTQHTAFQLGHVKALLIQCLAEMHIGAWLAAWLSIGAAVRILTYLGSDMGQAKLLRMNRARHTCLAAFVLETTIAFRIGAQTHLRRTIVEEIGLAIEDGLEEWSPWKDPLSDDSDTAREPVMAISTFNRLVKIAVRLHDQDRLSTNFNRDQSIALDIISNLIQNACLERGRKQPSVLVAAFPIETIAQNNPQRSESESAISPPNPHMWTNQISQRLGSSRHEHAPPFNNMQSLSAPPMGDSASTNKEYKVISPDHSSLHAVPAEQFQPHSLDLDIDNDAFFNPEIFEELASLERADPATARPQFMQNLGFGPDLDLAEFFGADYQPSDPMLAYVQT